MFTICAHAGGGWDQEKIKNPLTLSSLETENY